MKQILKNRLVLVLVTISSMTLLGGDTTSSSSLQSDERTLDQEIQYSDTCRENPIVVEEREYAGYKIRISSAGDQFCHLLDIEKDGTRLYHDEDIGAHFYFGAELEKDADPFIRLTGENDLNLVFSKWTGGAHCCYSLHIFKLNERFQEIANIGHGNFAPALEDIDHDGIPEIRVKDDVLAEVFSCFAVSAIGKVVLKYTDGSYMLSVDDMKKPPADLNSLSRQIESWRKMLEKREDADWLPPPFIQVITDLFYTGNKQTALELVDRVWPSYITGKEDFVKSYQDSIGESKFYQEFERQL